MRLQFHTCDVFTETRFAGNPLAIVEGADGLETEAMQTLAREFNLSETIFVQTPDDPAHAAKVRIFFPTAEIPFAGHPTIGCAIHLATKQHPEGDFETTIVLEEVAGLVPVRVSRQAGRIRAEFVAPVVPHGPTEGTAPSVKAAAEACGLPVWAVGFDGHIPAIWEGGPRFIFIPVATKGDLSAAKPMEPAWRKLTCMGATGGVYLYTRDRDSFVARMFAPTDGINEDPATGSASALLAAQLLAHGDLPEGESSRVLVQGTDMGRPSEIAMTSVVSGGALAEVRIAGSAVPVSEGWVSL